jgi:hypothetical protein
MLKPEQFDKKLRTLQEINKRMKDYDSSTSIAKVAQDHSLATSIYEELTETILALQEREGE